MAPRPGPWRAAADKRGHLLGSLTGYSWPPGETFNRDMGAMYYSFRSDEILPMDIVQ